MIHITEKIKVVGIYKITSPSNKVYIGQTTNWEARYKKYLKLYCKKQPKIYYSLVKYGIQNHKFEVIEECPESYLDELEFWRKIFYGERCVEKGLNCLYFDKSPGRWRVKSFEERQKISKNNRGKKRNMSSDSRKAISNTFKGNKYNLGLKRSFETKQKTSLKRKGTKFTKEHIINMSLSRKGKKLNMDHKLKISKGVG